MKNFTKIVICLVVLVAVGVLVYSTIFKKVEAPQSVNTNQSVPANWVTYTDAVSGISLKAPADFVVKDHDKNFSDAGVYLFIIPTSTPYVHTHLLHEALISINTPTTTCSQEDQDIFASSTQATIDGVMFTRSKTGGVGAGNIYQGIDYTTTRNGLCYRVSLFTHSTDGEGFYSNDPVQIQKIDALQAIDIKDLFALFDQIAGTIKFTK